MLKQNPLLKYGFDYSEKNPASSDFIGVVGVDYTSVYDAIADGKKIIYLTSDTVEPASWSLLIHGTGKIIIVGIGIQKKVRIYHGNNYAGTEYSDLEFYNIELYISGSINVFRNYNKIYFNDCFLRHSNHAATLTYYGNNEINAGNLHIQTENNAWLIWGLKNIDYLKITSNQTTYVNNNIYINNGTVKYLSVEGNFYASSIWMQYHFLILEGNAVVEFADIKNIDYTAILLNGESAVLNGGDTKFSLRMGYKGSKIFNLNLKRLEIILSGFEKDLIIKNCNIDYLYQNLLFAEFKDFSNNKINSNIIIQKTMKIDNCEFYSIQLQADNCNIQNSKCISGTIDLNLRDKTIIIGNRTLTPINLSGGTNTEASHNILI